MKKQTLIKICIVLLTRNCFADEIHKSLEIAKDSRAKILDLGYEPGVLFTNEETEIVAAAINKSGITHLNLNGKLGNITAIIKILPETSITHLNIGGSWFGRNGFVAIFDALKNSRIESLIVSDNGRKMEDAETVILAGILSKTGIKSLDLSGNKIGEKGARAIAAVLNKTKITDLSLAGNSIGVQGALELMRSKITRLNLKSANLGHSGAVEIARELGKTSLMSLNLGDNDLGLDGALAITKALDKTRITSLNLGSNGLGVAGIVQVLNAIKPTEIVDLNLDNNTDYVKPLVIQNDTFVDKWGSTKIGNSLNRNLVSLDLGTNDLTNRQIVDIAKIINGSSIRNLNLKYNRIGCEGVVAIANILNYTKIRSLDLSGNGIGTEGGKILAEALRSSTVISLNIGYNLIEDEGMEAIAEILKETEIVDLNLAMNENTIKGDIAVVRGLAGSGITALVMYGARPGANVTFWDFLDVLMETLPESLITVGGLRIGEYLEPGAPAERRDDGYHVRMLSIFNKNRLAVDGLYREFLDLVYLEGEFLEFVGGTELARCYNFTGIVKGREEGYIKHFLGYEEGIYREGVIEEFLRNVEKKVRKCAEYYSYFLV